MTLTTPDSFNDIAKAIQLSLAPVFLLTGIAGMLGVIAGRLARIIDRGRALTEQRGGPMPSEHGLVDLEHRNLERRRYFASVAITASTIAALLVCMVIAALFLEAMLGVRLNGLVGILFTAAMLALIVSLTYFLREVRLAMRSVHIPVPEVK